MLVASDTKINVVNTGSNYWLDESQENQATIFSFLNKKNILASILKAEKGSMLSQASFFDSIYKKIDSRNKKYAANKSL